MSTEKSDLELVAEVKKGRHPAFEELISRYSEKAYNLASRLTRNKEDAEEVLQDVFITVFRKIGGFEGKSSFSSWFYRVTVNASLMKLRKRNQERTIHLEDIQPRLQNNLLLRTRELDGAENIAYRKELVELMESAIRRLPDDYRPVFVLRDIDGLTSREVSKILDLSIPAVKSRLHRSRHMLKKRLAAMYKEYRYGVVSSAKAAAENA